MRNTLILFFFFIIEFTFAQVTELTGAILIGKSELMSYMIVYEINENNQISGYSVADLNGISETKAKISGEYNPKKKSLRFEEKKIISSLVKIPFGDFCLMKVNGKFEKKNGKHIFTGKFISAASNTKLSCDSGTIIMTTAQEIYEIAAKASKIIDKMPLPDSVSKALNEKIGPIKGVEKVKTVLPGSITEYTIKTDTIQLDILDDMLEDGDKISIYKNNSKIVSELATTNEVKTMRFGVPRDEKVVVFTIVACNEGTSPPNTIKVVLTNGKQKELIIAQLRKDQTIKIMLKR
ncbi:MAG: hypothetical protein IPH88_01825 [Bacteroidales bacterium]|nr:hypothetical protein [Bacteroidales bacterium]